MGRRLVVDFMGRGTGSIYRFHRKVLGQGKFQYVDTLPPSVVGWLD
jgi:hypothetical protein